MSTVSAKLLLNMLRLINTYELSCMQTTASESNIFDHLINIWEFNPGPVPGTCDLYFLVDFKFQSPLYRQVHNFFSPSLLIFEFLYEKILLFVFGV